MTRVADLSQEEIDVYLSALDVYRGNIPLAARFLGIKTDALTRLVAREKRKAEKAILDLSRLKRPSPPESLLDEDLPSFVAAPDLAEWIQNTFIQEGAKLYNEEHAHLAVARIGVVWTNVGYMKQGNRVVGMAEIPRIQGHLWAKARCSWHLEQFLGFAPDFLITLDAPAAVEADNPTFCARVDHELYHCGQKLDQDGEPAYGFDENPIWCIRGHDVEEFVGVTRRWGPGASAGQTQALVRAGSRKPEIARATIRAACGTCR